MIEWNDFILEDVVEKFIDYRGKTPTKVSSGIPLITAKIVKDGKILEPNEFISFEDYHSWMTRGYPEVNDLVLTTEAPLGEVALLKNKEVALAQRIITLRTKKAICNSVYLKYFFQNDEGQQLLHSRATGTTVEGIKSAELKKIQISLPSLKIQESIAEVLSSLDDKIDLLHRQNKTLEQMAETLFRQWFIEEENGDWKEGCLDDFIFNVKNTINANEIEENTKYIGLEHISRRNIALSDYGDAKSVVSNKFQFIKGNILFGKLRPYFHKVCIAPFDGVCSTDILVLKPKTIEYTSLALFALFQNDVIEYSNASSGGTRMPRTSWEILKRYPIKVPPISEIKLFEEQASVFIEKVFLNIKQIKSLEDQRDLLLPKLMNGSIRVTNN